MENASRNWSELEFCAIDLGDKRLDDRFQATMEKLYHQPMSPINKACATWSDTKAAYRLFDNKKLDLKKILLPHQERTVERMQSEKVILAIQDTTFLNYDAHFAKKGLGAIGSSNNKIHQGLVIHNTLAVTTEGLSLGLLEQQIYARRRNIKEISNKTLPIEEKESFRWLKAMRRVFELTDKKVRVVTLGDREADIFELFHFGQESGSEFVIRASWDRILDNEKTNDKKYLWDFMKKQPLLGKIEISIPIEDGKTRLAFTEIKIGKIKLKCPQRKGKRLSDVGLYAVWLKEPLPPKGVKPIEWMLLTNIICSSFKDAMEKINWYKTRWQIEIFHKILKSGCKVEDCRLEEVSRLERYLTVMSIIAWRLHWMTYMNRVVPDESCTIVFADYEWKALYLKINKEKSFPKKPPNVRHAIRWMAQLGGFLARKSDKEPGIVSIWRGWQRLHDIAESFLLFNHETCG